YRIAELASREGDDPALLASSVLWQSCGLAEAGEYVTAQQRLAGARQVLGHGDLATHAWLLAREAENLAAMGDPAAKGMIENASELLVQAGRSVRARVWTRCLQLSNWPHNRLTIATRLADETGVHSYVGDLTTLADDPTTQGKYSGRWLASVGLALVTLGDVHEGIQAGWRSLEAVKTSQDRFALHRLTALDAA